MVGVGFTSLDKGYVGGWFIGSCELGLHRRWQIGVFPNQNLFPIG